MGARFEVGKWGARCTSVRIRVGAAAVETIDAARISAARALFFEAAVLKTLRGASSPLLVAHKGSEAPVVGQPESDSFSPPRANSGALRVWVAPGGHIRVSVCVLPDDAGSRPELPEFRTASLVARFILPGAPSPWRSAGERRTAIERRFETSAVRLDTSPSDTEALGRLPFSVWSVFALKQKRKRFVEGNKNLARQIADVAQACGADPSHRRRDEVCGPNEAALRLRAEPCEGWVERGMHAHGREPVVIEDREPHARGIGKDFRQAERGGFHFLNAVERLRAAGNDQDLLNPVACDREVRVAEELGRSKTEGHMGMRAAWAENAVAEQSPKSSESTSR